MTQTQPIITIIGGSGFVGRYVVRQLAQAGYRIRIVTRNPESALSLKTSGDPGQISLLSGNMNQPESLIPALAGAFAVVNLVGILFEKGPQNFTSLHAKSAENLAKLAKKAGVKRLIHLSALGVDQAFGSSYARTKLMGEKSVLAAFPEATILRPSIIFGAEDRFFNHFATMPFLPLIGGGKCRFQPVYVDDVAKAVAACLAQPQSQGMIYELGGNTSYSFRALLQFTQKTLRSRKPILRLSFGMAMSVAFCAEIAFKFLPLLRAPLLTRDQVRLLKYDNLVNANARTLASLGITPQPMETVVPRYLDRYNPEKRL